MSRAPDRTSQVTKALLLYRSRKWSQSETGYCDWLQSGKPVSKRNANKFLLGCILDYQMRAETVWENAHRLTEKILNDPPDLWNRIASYSKSAWMSKWRVWRVHRFPKAHFRIWRIAREIVSRYDGDARRIWRGQSADAVSYRLNDLGLGKQITRMASGALRDEGQIPGEGDLKVDLNVRRVLGRLLTGSEYRPSQEDEVTRITRKMTPKNPWLLDFPLYSIGKEHCFATRPDCSNCEVRAACKYFENH